MNHPVKTLLRDLFVLPVLRLIARVSDWRVWAESPKGK
jgi:hypothetical protein